MKSLLDPTFRYTPAVATDLRKTFARIRRERAAAPKADNQVVELRSAIRRRGQ